MVEMPEYIYACHMICSIYCLLHFGKLILKKLKASSPKKKDTEKYLTLECMECNYCTVKSLKEKCIPNSWACSECGRELQMNIIKDPRQVIRNLIKPDELKKEKAK